MWSGTSGDIRCVGEVGWGGDDITVTRTRELHLCLCLADVRARNRNHLRNAALGSALLAPHPHTPLYPPVPLTALAPLMQRWSELQPPLVRVRHTSRSLICRIGSSARGSSQLWVYRKVGGKSAGAST